MKFNWGFGIAIFYGTFMAILLFFVVRSASYDHSLVMENYYEQDINYQTHYDKIANANALGDGLQVDYRAAQNLLHIRFPEEGQAINGSITFFKPSDKKQDFRKTISLGVGRELELATEKMSRGFWRVQLDWEDGRKQYYRETELTL